MSTTLACFAYASLLTLTPHPTELAFQKSYVEARQLGKDQAKPLAVFFGSGESGWEKICKDGKVAVAARRTLAENYVCVYADRSEESGKRLAADFEMNGGPGLVISNRDGSVQAFRLAGDMTGDQLTQQLTRYADKQLTVRHTETLAPHQPRTSHYQAPVQQPQYFQSYYPSFGGFSGGCAGGR